MRYREPSPRCAVRLRSPPALAARSMKILAVSYFFPPIGGAGVQRNLRLASHLSSLGVEMAVLTGPGTTTSIWAPRDDGSSAETPREIQVTRLSRAEPRVTPFRGRTERTLRIDSPWTRWWREGVGTEGRGWLEDATSSGP